MRIKWLALLLALLGAGLMAYPSVATWLSDREQRLVAQELGKEVALLDQAVLDAELARAREYNAHHADVPGDHERYEQQLRRFDAMAELSIPAIGLHLPVYHGTSDETLMRGVGHLYGTDLPIGDDSGEGRRSVLTAHTGIPTATLFDSIPELKEGDAIYVRTLGTTLKYEVSGQEVVLPDALDAVHRQPGEDLITLLTCTPYGINTHRLLVTATRVPLEEDPAEAFATAAPGHPYWAYLPLLIAIAVAVATWQKPHYQPQHENTRRNHANTHPARSRPHVALAASRGAHHHR